VNINRALLLKYFLIILVTLPLFYSCSIQKRYHRKGYTITWKKNDRVKSHSPSKKLIVDKQEVRDKIVSSKSKSDSTSRIVENNGRIPNESQPEPKYGGYENSLYKKETKAPLVGSNLRKKLKTSLNSRIMGENLKKERSTSAKIQLRKSEMKAKIISKFKKPNYFEDADDLWITGGLLLLVGLILYLIGAVLALSGFALASSVFLISATVVWIIAGIVLLMAIFSAFLCIITLGMIC
jgi:hypothetical protein